MADNLCTWDASTFTATAVYTGENRMVRVAGTGECPQSGFRVELVRGPVGIVPEPTRLSLRFKETPPEIGTPVITPETVDELFEVSQEVTHVGIMGLGQLIEVSEPA